MSFHVPSCIWDWTGRCGSACPGGAGQRWPAAAAGSGRWRGGRVLRRGSSPGSSRVRGRGQRRRRCGPTAAAALTWRPPAERERRHQKEPQRHNQWILFFIELVAPSSCSDPTLPPLYCPPHLLPLHQVCFSHTASLTSNGHSVIMTTTSVCTNWRNRMLPSPPPAAERQAASRFDFFCDTKVQHACDVACVTLSALLARR